MNEPITLDELKALGRRIDSDFVFAANEAEMYEKLNANYRSWTLLRCPVWFDDRLIAFVVKPRDEGDEELEAIKMEASKILDDATAIRASVAPEMSTGLDM